MLTGYFFLCSHYQGSEGLVMINRLIGINAEHKFQDEQADYLVKYMYDLSSFEL